MIQTMQFTYGHLVSINSIELLYYIIFTKNYIFQNIHSKFYKEKHIVSDIIHYYKNDFVLHTHSFFMIEKTTNVVVDE
jgi:hypothetical protein